MNVLVLWLAFHATLLELLHDGSNYFQTEIEAKYDTRTRVIGSLRQQIANYCAVAAKSGNLRGNGPEWLSGCKYPVNWGFPAKKSDSSMPRINDNSLNCEFI